MPIQSQLLWGLLFSSVGLGFLLYGRSQKAVVPFLCGIGLMVVPYFVANVPLLIGLGILFSAAPYFLRL